MQPRSLTNPWRQKRAFARIIVSAGNLYPGVLFFKIASTSSPTNKTHILQDTDYPFCFPPSSSARIQPLNEHECRQTLGVFLRILLFNYSPTLIYNLDKARSPNYVLALGIPMYEECLFGLDILLGRDACIDLEAVIYRAHVLIAARVGKAEYDGRRSCVVVPGSLTWINVDTQYWVSLANITENGSSNITDNFELVLNSSTAAVLPALSAISEMLW